MNSYIEFDPFAKSQNQRPPLAKVAKMAKERSDFSQISHFSQSPPMKSDLIESAVEILDSALAFSEIGGFPVRSLFDLPLPPSLVLSVCGIIEPVILDFRRRSAETRRHSRCQVEYDSNEIDALLLGAENDRIYSTDFHRFCSRKLTAGWRLNREEALNGAVGVLEDPQPQNNWTTNQLLGRIGATLRLIVL